MLSVFKVNPPNSNHACVRAKRIILKRNFSNCIKILLPTSSLLDCLRAYSLESNIGLRNLMLDECLSSVVNFNFGNILNTPLRLSTAFFNKNQWILCTAITTLASAKCSSSSVCISSLRIIKCSAKEIPALSKSSKLQTIFMHQTNLPR